MATINEKIAGLYVAFFDRAADKNGLDYWTSQAQSIGEDTAVKELAARFAFHVKFTQLYDGLSNSQYVEAIYTNCLGSPGDQPGVNYWTASLDSGMTRSDMVALFVSGALDFNQNDPQFSDLSQIDIDLALQRQAQLANKVNVSLNFVDSLAGLTNLDPDTDVLDPNALILDDAYSASVKIISQVTHDQTTVQAALNSVGLIQDRSDAIIILNNVNNINEQEVNAQINLQNQAIGFSNTNSLLGTLSSSDTYGVSALDSGLYWDQSVKTITYSFNDFIPPEYYTFESDSFSLTQGWEPLDTAQRDAFRSIAQQVNQLLGITLQEVSSDGQIRLNLVTTDYAGFALYPGTFYGYEGDVFLSTEYNVDTLYYGLNPGEMGWGHMTHELGHALGLKHPFEGESTLPSDEDDRAHSIMSYTWKNSYKPELEWDGNGNLSSMGYVHIGPQLFSLYDVAALQAFYGVNNTNNTDDTTYTFSFSDFTIQTIWDAGGIDTLDLFQNQGNTTLDLRGGTLNSVDQYSLEQVITYFQNQVDSYHYDYIETNLTDLYTNNNLYTGLNNIAIAHGTVIENITTGSGNDTITDNEVDNIIYTSLGDDTIYIGNGGHDYVDAGGGTDALYLDVYSSDQIVVTTWDMDTYSIVADTFAVDVTGVETVHFNDNTVYAINLLV